MDKILELAKQAGIEDAYFVTPHPGVVNQLRKFYTLARADLEAENAKLKEMYALLASAWFYGGWEAETHNERLMQKLMQEAGYWPTTEEEIVARAALGEK